MNINTPPPSQRFSFRRVSQAVAMSLAVSLGVSAYAGTLTDNFNSETGTVLGRAKVEAGVLKLTDVEDLNNGAGLPLQGSYVFGDIDAGARVGSFDARFKIRIGGGTERPAQGMSFVFSSELSGRFTPFREAGGLNVGTGEGNRGLIVSFDTVDNVLVPGVSSVAEGNPTDAAPGIIVYQFGTPALIRKMPVRTGDRFVDVRVTVTTNGALSLFFDGRQIFTNEAIGYIPIAGNFGFGAGTEEVTSANRDNHWVDDVNITTTVVEGEYIASFSPLPRGARPDAVVRFEIGDLFDEIRMRFDGQNVVPTISVDNFTIVTYDPPGLLAPNSTHTVELTYGVRTFRYSFTVVDYPTLPASYAVTGVDTSCPGFRVSVRQSAETLADSQQRAEDQLAGLVGGANIADLTGANPDGTFTVRVLNFEQDGLDFPGESFGMNTLIPGITGANGTDNIALEAIGYAMLAPGTIYNFVLSSDDGAVLRIGSNPKDVLTSREIARSGDNSVVGSFAVTQAGFYPIRVLWWEAGGRAQLEVGSQDAAGARLLLNDMGAGAIPVYCRLTGGAALPPAVTSVAPAPGVTNVPVRPDIEVTIIEDRTVVETNSVVLRLNGTVVAATVSKAGLRTRVTFRPPTGLNPNTVQNVEVAFRDNGGNNITRSWTFTTAGGCVPGTGSSGTVLAGYWDFSGGNLKAKFGQDLEYKDSSVASHYKFGTTGTGDFADVPPIDGKPAKVLCIPFTPDNDLERKLGLFLEHRMQANGGGQLVNQWTMIVDCYWRNEGRGFGTILRTHDLGGNLDGDLFWRASDGSYGKGCCSSYDGISQDAGHNHPNSTWARLVLSVDLAASPRSFAKYVNGFLHRSDVTGDANNLDSRFALPPKILLFNDGDDNEQSTVYVSAIQMRAGAMTAEEIAALGGPSADGIPGPYSQWDFNNGSLAATVGRDATYKDASVASHYKFGTTGEGDFADVPPINGQPAKVLCIPFTPDNDTERKLGLLIDHGLAPNGGGTLVNQWTLIVDCYWRNEGRGFGTILRTHDLAGNLDGDLFWRASDGSYGKGCCSSYDGISQDAGHNHPNATWARLVLSADLAASPRSFAKYVNGFLHRSDVTGDANNLDSRFALPPRFLMFNDGDDNEQSTVYINAIQIRRGAMTAEEVAALGGPSADGIPAPGGPVKAHYDFNGATVPAALGATLGRNLRLKDDSVASHYKVGVTGEGDFADVPGIGGAPARVLCIPFTPDNDTERKLGLLVQHGVRANGGGTLANQWTLIADLYWHNEGRGFGTILRTHDLNGNLDGDLFWRASDGSYGKGCCSSYDGISQEAGHNQRNDTWARLVLSVDMAASPRSFAKYINGFLHRSDVTGDANSIDGRFALPPEILMFNDGDDNEQSTVYVNSLQIREGAMSPEAIAALGGPSATGIPIAALGGGGCDDVVVVCPRPRLVIERIGSQVRLSWSALPACVFTLESKQNLTDAQWTPVAGVQNNAVGLNPTELRRFYRLRRP